MNANRVTVVRSVLLCVERLPEPCPHLRELAERVETKARQLRDQATMLSSILRSGDEANLHAALHECHKLTCGAMQLISRGATKGEL